MRRGEVRWYTFQAPDKRRLVLILTRSSAVGFLDALTIAPITTTIRDIPSEVVLSPEDGLPADCAANMDNIQTVPKHRLGSLIASLSSERMEEVNQAIAFALGSRCPYLWVMKLRKRSFTQTSALVARAVRAKGSCTLCLRIPQLQRWQAQQELGGCRGCALLSGQV